MVKAFPAKVKKGKIKNKVTKSMSPYFFIAPFFISFLVFGTFPIIYSFYLSFFSWNGIKEMSFVGLKNYQYILLTDMLFWRSLLQTFIMNVLSVIPQHIAAIALAYILNQGLVRLKNFFKGVLFLPYITSTVAVSMIFWMIGGERYGPVNLFLQTLQDLQILSMFGNFQLPIYFLQYKTSWFFLSFIIFWKWIGWNTILYLAGLQTINKELYEAAKIDGANNFAIFMKITIPLLKPIIFFATSISIIYGMQLFDEPMAIIGVEGIINYQYYALTTSIYMYMYAFRWGKFGIATASSYALCLVILFISTIYQKIMNKGEI